MINKLCILLLTTTSLYAVGHYTPEECANFRKDAHLNKVINHKSFKMLPTYLHIVKPFIVYIPCASEHMQNEYLANFIAYYNTVLFKASSDVYCSLYGVKDENGDYYNTAYRCDKVHRHLMGLIKEFEESYDLSESHPEQMRWAKRLTILPTGEYTIRGYV